MKENNVWKKTFFVILLLGILLVSAVLVVDKPKIQVNPNSDCTGYVLNGFNYCSEGAYKEYMQTVKITAPLIENYRQLSELGINN